jgi:predicted secreted acid phosphatase
MRLLRSIWVVVMGILREIADESAYARHLAAHGRKHSAEEWRHFSEERLRAKYQRAKCC